MCTYFQLRRGHNSRPRHRPRTPYRYLPLLSALLEPPLGSGEMNEETLSIGSLNLSYRKATKC